jgi:hypothetical protein
MRIHQQNWSEPGTALRLAAWMALTPIFGNAASISAGEQTGFAVRAAEVLAQEPAQPQDSPANQQPEPNLPGKDAASTVFTGTIVKSGTTFLLRIPTGDLYRLDPPSSVEAYAGKSVKVMGKLELNARIIHVESIEALDA